MLENGDNDAASNPCFPQLVRRIFLISSSCMELNLRIDPCVDTDISTICAVFFIAVSFGTANKFSHNVR